MDGAIALSVRVICAATALFISWLLMHETWRRGKARRFDLAFLLSLSCSGIAIGLFVSQAWNAAYHYTVLSGTPAAWMLTSGVVAGSTVCVLFSAFALMHTLTLSLGRSLLYLSIILSAGTAGYFIGVGIL